MPRSHRHHIRVVLARAVLLWHHPSFQQIYSWACAKNAAGICACQMEDSAYCPPGDPWTKSLSGGGSILPLKRDFSLLQGPASIKPVPLLWNHSYFPVVSSLLNAKKLDKSLMLFVLLPCHGRFFYSSNLLITMFLKINLAIYKTIT